LRPPIIPVRAEIRIIIGVKKFKVKDKRIIGAIFCQVIIINA
jgi:hypothetical protein